MGSQEVKVAPNDMHPGRPAALALLAATLALSGTAATRADTVTECVDSFCYCVNSDLKPAIEQHVAYIRGLIGPQKAQGKAIGYMSIPISTVGGSYIGVNAKVGAEVKEHVEDRFGPKVAWLLNPAGKDVALPSNATGADYMLMWTQVFAGKSGLGEDFDFIYFVGPSDFARHFSLDGNGDMQKLDDYYEGLAKTDPKLREVDKKSFREYYALRASVSYSLGSHDEWNIARAINEARRKSNDFGISKQLGMLFDGRAVAPGLFETPIAAGAARKCGEN
jgi:hypothetical protein